MKSAPPPPNSSIRGGAAPKARGINPLFAGIVIGMVLGVAMALGIALWINRESNVFVDKTQPVAPLPAPPKPAGSAPATIAPDTGQAQKPDPDKPRFDFYKILPGEDKSAAGVKSTPAQKPAPAATKGPDIKPATEEYFLQAGAFQNQSEAEAMRAKVAFSGFQSSIRTVNLPDKGTLYRVRLGPYKSLEEVSRVKTALGQSGIAAAVVNKD
jgi:cell division protein FtsN